MTTLTAKEKVFLEQGGTIWCMRPAPNARWEVYKLTWEAEEVFDTHPPSAHQAAQWLFLLADLSGPSTQVAVHHAVARPLGLCDAAFPVLV